MKTQTNGVVTDDKIGEPRGEGNRGVLVVGVFRMKNEVSLT